MSRENKVIFFALLIWACTRYTLSVATNSDLAFRVGALTNLLLLLAVTYWALRDHYGNATPSDSNFIVDMKQAMKAGGKYVLAVSVLILLNYLFLQDEYLQSKIDSRVEASRLWLEEDGNFDRLQLENPLIAEKSKEELLADKRKEAGMFFDAKTQALFSLMALLFMAIFYSVLLTIIFRRLLYKTSSTGGQ